MQIVILTDDEVLDFQLMMASTNEADRKFARKVINRLSEPITHTKKVARLMETLNQSLSKGEKALFQAVSNYFTTSADDYREILESEDIDEDYTLMMLKCISNHLANLSEKDN